MIDYAADVKRARMGVVAEAVAGGYLEILDGEATVVRIPLGTPVQLGGLLQFGTAEGVALRDGEPDAARMVRGADRVVTGLKVGTDVVIDDDRIELGQTVRMISCALRHA